MPIAGILHRGLDEQGHLQCAGLHQGQWMIFNDGVEARLLAEGAAPRAEDWVCIWRIRYPRLRSVTPQHYVRGHDARVHQLMDYVTQHRWQELEANETVTKYFSLHCGACAQLFLDAGSLAKHVFRRHSAIVHAARPWSGWGSITKRLKPHVCFAMPSRFLENSPNSFRPIPVRQ